MSPVYQKIIEEAWAKTAQKRQEARIEAQQKSITNGTAYHPEHLKHINMKGKINRSKSEIIIGNIYDSLKIPYSYEERIYWPENAPREAWIIKHELGQLIGCAK